MKEIPDEIFALMKEHHWAAALAISLALCGLVYLVIR